MRAGALAGPFDAKISVGSPRKDSLEPFLILSRPQVYWPVTGRPPAGWAACRATGLRTAWLAKEAEGTISLASKGRPRQATA